MKSDAAIWAGEGAPPQLTAGDTAAMAAPRGNIDPSLSPDGGPVESTNTTDMASAAANNFEIADGKNVKQEAGEAASRGAEVKAAAAAPEAAAGAEEPKPDAKKAAPEAAATPEAAPAAAAAAPAVAATPAAAPTMNAEIPGSFMAVFWLLVIGTFALVIAVVTKIFCQHKRNSELMERRNLRA